MEALENKKSERSKKDRVTAMIGTAIFFSVIFVLFLILGFRGAHIYDEPEGAYVILGDADYGSPGMVSQDYTPVRTEPQQMRTPSQQTAAEEVLTQDIDDVSISMASKKDDKKTDSKRESVKDDSKQQQETKEPDRKSDPRFEFSQTTGGTGTKCTSDQKGNQGSTSGDPNATNYGPGGGSGNFSFNLSGRGVIQGPPKIEDNTQKVEKIVIEIAVNRDGYVMRANATIKGGGSATTGPLVDKSIAAARKVRFTPNPNATEEQYGTITFNFTLK